MFISAVILGICGTAVMTLFMYVMSYLTHEPVKVVKILGTMLTFQTTSEKGLSNSRSTIVTGIIAHYIVGVFFALPYLILCNYNVLEPTLIPSLFYGFVAGIFAMIIWRLFFLIHPNPPFIPLRVYLVDLLVGHVFFSLGVWIAYKILIDFSVA